MTAIHPRLHNNMDIIEQIIERTKTLLSDKQRLIIAIDGRCASGKTTLAKKLNEAEGWSVFHTDDFFLRPGQRTAERLNTPGENVDHERFLEEVLLPLANSTDNENDLIRFRPFDCKTKSLAEPVCVRAGKICVVEGSYSCHPSLWDYYGLRIFMTVDPEEQMRRIILREGGEKARQFAEMWIPLEEKYFSAYDVRSRCELCF